MVNFFRGRFLRVSQTVGRGGPRSQLAIPAQVPSFFKNYVRLIEVVLYYIPNYTVFVAKFLFRDCSEQELKCRVAGAGHF